jgi:general L-amino acid transport system substrate-binding protein
MKHVLTTVICAAALGLAASTADAQTLNTVKTRGVLNCGANGSLAGFGQPDPQGNWIGLDVDLCRAVAAAIFDDPTKVKFVALTAKDRFTGLQSGEVDLLSRNTTWTLSRDTALGLNFTSVLYYDWAGLHRPQVAQGQLGARARRRYRLRRAGDDDRAQPRRLFPRQQDEAQDRHVCDG